MAIGHPPRLKYNEPVGYNENRVQPVVSAASLCCDPRLMLIGEDRSKGGVEASRCSSTNQYVMRFSSAGPAPSAHQPAGAS
jgi:hypothetical protein